MVARYVFSARQEAERMTRSKGTEWLWLGIAIVWIGILTANHHLNHTLRIVCLVVWVLAGLRSIYSLVMRKRRNTGNAGGAG